MLADASWPVQGVFLSHLSLSLSAFVFEVWPAPFDIPWPYITEYMYIVCAWLDNMCTYIYSV